MELIPPANHCWFSLLDDLPSMVWQTFWKRAIREDGSAELKTRLDGPWVQSLKWIAESGILDLPGSLHLFGGDYDELSAKLEQTLREQLETKREAFFSMGMQDTLPTCIHLPGKFHLRSWLRSERGV